jgi:tetratricopeptide (TPR) repeat protein
MDHQANSTANSSFDWYARYEETGDMSLLEKAIQVERELLELRPSLRHPNRANICGNVAALLQESFRQTSDVSLLDEAISLNREALSLRPRGHYDRAKRCSELGASLYRRYTLSSDIALLNEAIEMKREALALHPPGHFDRAMSCVGLSIPLQELYYQSGDVTFLDNAIELSREALTLRPPGHSARARSCTMLGIVLHARYEQTGDFTLLHEAIKLDREARALTLQPVGHPARANSCANLGASLQELYYQTGIDALLDESIELKREALALYPPCHPDRASSCTSLGTALQSLYTRSGDVLHLDETIELKREAVALHSPGSRARAQASSNLAYSLSESYRRIGNVSLIDEAIDICNHSLGQFPPSQAWTLLVELAKLHLIPECSQFSVAKASEYLHQSCQHEVHSVQDFMLNICSCLSSLWNFSSMWTPHITATLVDVYNNIADRLPLLAGFVLDTPSRLQALKFTRRIGSDACVAAVLAKRPSIAVVLLDCGHGVVWTQAIHQRHPQMEGAPRDLAAKLENLLRVTALPKPTMLDKLPYSNPHLTFQDIRHKQNAQIRTILRDIRQMPGLERFMLGSTFDTLREAANSNPIVILVAAHSHVFALIMPGATRKSPDVLHLDLTWDNLLLLERSAKHDHNRYRAGARDPSSQSMSLDDTVDPTRAMRPGNYSPLNARLARLWVGVVKPVLMHLGLAVG